MGNDIGDFGSQVEAAEHDDGEFKVLIARAEEFEDAEIDGEKS